MNEEMLKRRNRYSGQNIRYVKNEKKATINFNLNELNTFCAYAVTINNMKIKKKNLFNMRNLFYSIDLERYKMSDDLYNRAIFIRRAMDARLNQGLEDPNLIISAVNGGMGEDDLVDRLNFINITFTDGELDYINNTISSCLQYIYIYENVDDTIKACTDFKAEDFDNKAQAAKNYSRVITKAYTDLMNVTTSNDDELTFSLREDKLEPSLTVVKDQLSNPSLKLRTCIKGMNEMLGGGFEGSRIYMFLGLAGVGKSMTMLNLAYQMKKANKDYTTKDPDKIPAIVYLTMENTVRETIQRLYEMIVGQDKDMSKLSVQDIVNLLKSEGELYLSSESPIDIIIKYKPNNSVDTNYLYELDEELQFEGYEMICLIQDHIKRIRPVNRRNDIRLDLGEVVNEMKVFAQLKDIPVITVSHINREGSRKVEEASRVGRQNITKLLGRSTVGESMLMIDNLDGAYVIGKEKGVDGDIYLGINRIKERYKCTDESKYITIPYEKNNDIRLKEDLFTTENIVDVTKKKNIKKEMTTIDFAFEEDVRSRPDMFYTKYKDTPKSRLNITIPESQTMVRHFVRFRYEYRFEHLHEIVDKINALPKGPNLIGRQLDLFEKIMNPHNLDGKEVNIYGMNDGLTTPEGKHVVWRCFSDKAYKKYMQSGENPYYQGGYKPKKE